MLVHFTSTSAPYRGGEIYDLDPSQADDLIRRGVAIATQRQETHTYESTELLRSMTYTVGSGATYDGSGRITAYTRFGIAHQVTYSSTQIVVTNDTGAQVTIDLDGSGRYLGHQWGYVIPVPPVVMATHVTLDGPTSGYVGVSSTAFTVELDGEVEEPVVVRPSDLGAGGFFAPTMLVLDNDNPSDTFAYLPISIGNKAIVIINDSGLINGDSIQYVVSNAPPPSGTTSLDFTSADNSQYLALTGIGVH